MWEVFNPINGLAIVRTRFETLARLYAWLLNADYNLIGSGWINPPEWDSID